MEDQKNYEQKLIEHVSASVDTSIQKYINGKIDRLHNEMMQAHEVQQKNIESMQNDIKDILDAFNQTSTFFKVLIQISQFIIPTGSAVGLLYGLIKWIRN